MLDIKIFAENSLLKNMELTTVISFEYNSEKYIVKAWLEAGYYRSIVCYEDGTEAYKSELSISFEDDIEFEEKHGKRGLDQILEDVKNEFINYLNTNPAELL